MIVDASWLLPMLIGSVIGYVIQVAHETAITKKSQGIIALISAFILISFSSFLGTLLAIKVFQGIK